MDRQADSRSVNASGRLNFKYLLLAYAIHLGLSLLGLGISYASSSSPLWYEMYYDGGNYGIAGRLLYSVVLGDLQCLLTAPLFMVTASLVYRALKGIDAKRLGGFFRVNVWLRSTAVCLPCTLISAIFNDIILYLCYSVGSKAGEFLLTIVIRVLQTEFWCVYYGFAACDPMKNITLGKIYKAGLKKAVHRPIRLILTAALCTAANYLLCTLPMTALNNAVLWQGRGTYYLNARKPVLDYRINTAIGLILSSLSWLVQALIFYLVMFSKKRTVKAAADTENVSAADNADNGGILSVKMQSAEEIDLKK